MALKTKLNTLCIRSVAAGAVLATVAGCAQSVTNTETIADQQMPMCANESINIYFDEFSDKLTEPSKEAMKFGLDLLSDCEVESILIVGKADATGTKDNNLELSEDRARAVAKFLVTHGMDETKLRAAAIGEAGAMVDGREVPLRRTAFIEVNPVQP